MALCQKSTSWGSHRLQRGASPDCATETTLRMFWIHVSKAWRQRGRLLMVRKSRCGRPASGLRSRENAGSIPAAHIFAPPVQSSKHRKLRLEIVTHIALRAGQGKICETWLGFAGFKSGHLDTKFKLFRNLCALVDFLKQKPDYCTKRKATQHFPGHVPFFYA